MADLKPTIMIVEDELMLLEAISKKIKLSADDVVSCASGQQALDYLANFDRPPDAIWLDYYLKDMDGLEFMRQLRKNHKWADIPVIVVSNSANPAIVAAMLDLGAKRFVLKAEHRLDDILKMIEESIKQPVTNQTTKKGIAKP